MLVALAIWGFVWVHAFSMDMTHDEAYSFRLIKTNYFIALFGTANTHWLNSFFMKIFSLLFGDGPGWLRLHSVLAFPFYAWGLYHLVRLIKSDKAKIVFVALLLFNPYVLDFFSLARGYGLALTFQVWSLVYFVRGYEQGLHYRTWMMVWLLNLLTIASNLSYFYTVMGMAGYYGWLLIRSKTAGQGLGKPAYRILFLYVLLLLGTVADLLFIKYYGKDLSYGGDSNLVHSLIGSIWEGSFYQASNEQLVEIFSWVSFAMLVLVCGYYGYGLLRTKKISLGLVLCLPFISLLALNIFFHLVLKTPYLFGRTALQGYVPGVLMICFAIGSWRLVHLDLQRITLAISALVVMAPVAHFREQANRQWCYEWSLQANSKQAIEDLYALRPVHPALGFSVGAVYTNYYHLLDSSLSPIAVELPDQEPVSSLALRVILERSDYVISAYPATIACLQQIGLRYEVLKTYQPGKNQLIRIYH
jgi:hypothetical protein